MFVFRKIWRALFSCNILFQIRPFALLPTSYDERAIQSVSLSSGLKNENFRLNWSTSIYISHVDIQRRSFL